MGRVSFIQLVKGFKSDQFVETDIVLLEKLDNLSLLHLKVLGSDMDENRGREAILKITLGPLRQLRIQYSVLLVEIEAERRLLLDVG